MKMNKIGAILTLLGTLALLGAATPPVDAQSSSAGSRKDDIIFGPSGHPIAGATITVCQSTATGTPCSPLATIYTDATLTTPASNPFAGDGIGNYHFYAPAGRYLVQISGPGMTTQTYPDVILPADLSSTASGNNISAFGLSLGGNLSVAGNATINGTLTTTNFNPGTFSPSSLAITGDASIGGPRPYIDVTAPQYGAKGDGSVNDGPAIQAAINAACATTIGGQSMHPDVFLPPGYYVVTQTQTPSTSAALTIACDVRLRGGGAFGPQFTRTTESWIIAQAGASPNAAPLLSITGSDIEVDNLQLDGWNQAVYVSGAGVQFDRVTLRVTHQTGMADNVPLKITDSLWVWVTNSTLSAASGTLPAALIDGENIAGTSDVTYAIFFSDDILSGGGVVYDQRTAPPGPIPGWMVFRNVTDESSAEPFFTAESTTSNSYAIGNLEFDNIQMADSTGNPPPIFETASGVTGTGIRVMHSLGGPAVEPLSGSTIYGYATDGFGGTYPPAYANGNPAYGGCNNGHQGMDCIETEGGPGNPGLYTDLTGQWNNSSSFWGAPLRLGLDNNPEACLGATAKYGILFSDCQNIGYHSEIFSPGRNEIGIAFANTNAPTNFAGAAATSGGSLADGTYYFALYPTVGANCNSGTGAPAVLNSGVTLSGGGGHGEINLTWTASVFGPGENVSGAGYCLVPSTGKVSAGNNNQAIYIGNGATASFSYTGQATSAVTLYAYNTMTEQHRFTPTALGINTTSPQFNLDVNGSAAVNSLNGVQKAERFTGSDAAAKINACLTAASTSGGICDARGLIGTFTGSSHIQIPAGTTLFWGTAQLTINDTTHNDAVELMGDGSSLVGYQESGSGTVPRPDSSGFIACQPSGCTTVKNPNAGTRNVDWVHISGMNLQATGASSTVLNLTSVGHADIENNRFVMGTGGNSYGIFGDTSTGGFDSTNTLIKHNEIDPQFQNDRCLHLAGVFNVVEMEQNNCILPAANTGTVCFEIAKDSSGNYPNNDEFYGNDCEGSSTSFGQIGYNIINADSVTIGPNNRCENVYNCFQFPVDGSAVGIHLLDPYISVSAVSVVKPNEPSTAQIAIDNNGPNWLPSMHYGINDLGGRNLLGNAGFEGWSNSTALYYWGGVTGTTINAAGSGIYAQQASSSSPADSTTQGTYNVKIGDNATAGLGINSACIQIDATMNYTLAFRVASSSTSVNFRPGFRFYSDPNCTEADKITSVATNARVLTPANYAGQSALIGTGTNPNWQSTNASLTYNNGISCNCNVTGADFNVAATNTWTPTRNFAITFRAPNAYSSTSTVAQSMRVFILENSAANPNQVYVDDAALSEGPVTPSVPATAGVSDSGTPVVYGNLTVDGSLTAGPSALPAALTSGTPTANDCAAFTSGTTTNIQDSGSACLAQLTRFSMGIASSGQAPGATNQVDVSIVYLPNIQFSHLTVDVSTTDSSTSDFYSWAITDLFGNVKCSVTAVNLTASGASDQSCTQGTVTLSNGAYIFAFTGNATTAKIGYSGTAPLPLSSAISSSSSSSGAMTFPISVPSAGVTYSSYGAPAIILH